MTGEAAKGALRVGFDRVIKFRFHDAKASPDAGLFPYRDLDEAAELTKLSAMELFDFHTRDNIRLNWAYAITASIEHSTKDHA